LNVGDCWHVQQNPAKRKYQIHLKSHSGPIYVLLVNKDSDGSSPVVVQVPPPKEEMDVDATEPAAENRQNGSRKATKVVILAAMIQETWLSDIF